MAFVSAQGIGLESTFITIGGPENDSPELAGSVVALLRGIISESFLFTGLEISGQVVDLPGQDDYW